MELGLRGKSALVCGASAGIGKAVAEALAAEGVDLLLVARRSELLSPLCEALRNRHGVRAEFVAADLSSLEGCEAALSESHRLFGGVDILVANAGGPPAGGFEASTSEEALKAAWELTFLSAVRLVRGVLPAMREKRWGRIVAITSVSVFEPIPGLALSNAYRPALTGLLKTLSDEVAHEGITVNSVCPGYTDTERMASLAQTTATREGATPETIRARWTQVIPAKRLGRPVETAAAVAFLCSQPAAYITGVALPVDGGRLRGLLA